MPPATTSDQALQNYQQFQSSMKAPQDILQGQEQSLGVPQAQQQVSGLRQAITNTTNLLNNIPGGVMGRTQNSLVTSAQANRQIQNESAPVTQNLNKQEQDYTGANTDLQNLFSRAGTLSSLQQTGQDQQLSALKGIYDTLFGKEQAARAQQLEEQKLAESAREANLSHAASSYNPFASLFNGNSGGGSSGSAATYGLKVANNPGAGYYFQDASGSPISALKYSQLTNTPFNTLIQKMANSGDTYAKSVMRYATPTGFNGVNASLAKLFTG